MASVNVEAYRRMCESGEFDVDISSERSRRAMLEAFTPDFEIVVPPSLPHGGTWRGRQEWLRMNELMRATWRSTNEPQHLWDVPDDDLVVLYSTKSWTAIASGVTVEFPSVELLSFRDAKICRVEMFVQDTRAILEALRADGDSVG